MTHIVSPESAATAIGLKTASTPGNLEDSMLSAIIHNLQASIEDSLNVTSLEHTGNADLFITLAYTQSLQLRLTNGFVMDGTVVITDPNGAEVTDPLVLYDYEMGIVTLPSTIAGRYTVTYESGFPSDEDGVMLGVPAWLSGLTILSLTMWCRSSLLSPKGMVKGVSLAELEHSLRRDISKRIYGRYMRPRAWVEWSAHYRAIPISS